MLKKICLFVVLISLFSSCRAANTGSAPAGSNPESMEPEMPYTDPSSETEGEIDLPQFSELQKGEEIAVIDTNYGEIIVRFFPEYAPLAVENFITHAKDGYYDDGVFHRVIEGFMIQGGDPLGTGFGGESIYGEGFGLEITPSLRHLRGALAMANSGQENSNGSQFYIVQNNKLDSAYVEQLKPLLDTQDEVVGENQDGSEVKVKDVLPSTMINAYLNDGGTIQLDGSYTVFGQTVKGLDVVDKIAATQTNDEDRPLEDVVINSITIREY